MQLKLSGSQHPQFVERVNVSFAYEAFDDPALSDIQPQSATYESEDTVTFQLSSIAISSAVVSFGSKFVPAASITISNDPISDPSVVTAILPKFTLAEATTQCHPSSSGCNMDFRRFSPIAVVAWLNVTHGDNLLVSFSQTLQLLLPSRPRPVALGNLVVDINKPSVIAFLIGNYQPLSSVQVGGVICPFVTFQDSFAVIVNVSIEKNTFLVSNSSDVLFESIVDPEYFSVNDGPQAIFRDFTIPIVEFIVPSFGPIVGGIFVTIFTKETSREMFGSCMFTISAQSSFPCVIVQNIA